MSDQPTSTIHPAEERIGWTDLTSQHALQGYDRHFTNLEAGRAPEVYALAAIHSAAVDFDDLEAVKGILAAYFDTRTAVPA